jgi:hypothetical protein
MTGDGRFAHHDLRHLFAPTCVKAGIDVPKVSNWPGRKDGGTFAMKIPDRHSAAAAKRVSFTPVDGVAPSGKSATVHFRLQRGESMRQVARG